MPIVRISPESYAPPPPYSWASKPDAPGNSGMRIAIPEFGHSVWVSNGIYWRPQDGECVLRRKNLQSESGPYATLTEVPNAFDGLIIPDDLLQSPGAPSFEVRAQGRRNGTLSAAQQYQLSIGTAADNAVFALSAAADSGAGSAVVRAYGYTTQITSSGNYQTSGINGFQDGGVMPGGTIAFESLSGQQIRLYARNGSADASESWGFHMCELAVRL